MASLNDETRSNVDFTCTDKLSILSELHTATEQSRQECIRKKLRYTRKSGEIVIISDIFSKVVKWIDLFKQIGDCVVQYDPGRAALPWAGVRFLLQVGKLSVNDNEKNHPKLVKVIVLEAPGMKSK